MNNRRHKITLAAAKFIYDDYIARAQGTSLLYPLWTNLHAVLNHPPASAFARRYRESASMLDLAFIAIGAVFLYVCVLYAYACDHL